MGHEGLKMWLLAALLAGMSFQSLAQTVTRSRQVPGLRPYESDLLMMSRAEKDSVRMVADLWRMYVESFTSASMPEGKRRSMWMDGAPDYLMEFDDGALLYSSFRENRILDVRKVGGGTYELTLLTRSKLPGEDYHDWVECVYRVCAMRVVPSTRNGIHYNPFRLCNWLDAVVPTLSRTTSGCLDYYCTQGCAVSKHDVGKMAAFAALLAREYAVQLPENIRYVVAPTVHQCEEMSGFLFNAYSNPAMNSASSKSTGYGFYGRTFGPNTLMSNYFDDRYNLALLILKSGRPDALPLVQKGIAAYHGGYMKYSYANLKSSLQRFLSTHEGLDLSREDALYDTAIPLSVDTDPGSVVVPLEGIVGAVLVEYSLKEGGSRKVKELLGCKDYLGVFRSLGVRQEDIGDFIRRIL